MTRLRQAYIPLSLVAHIIPAMDDYGLAAQIQNAEKPGFGLEQSKHTGRPANGHMETTRSHSRGGEAKSFAGAERAGCIISGRRNIGLRVVFSNNGA